MERFAFVSRHVPTERQHQLAAEKGIILVHVGDVDAFRGDFGSIRPNVDFAGCVVVNAAAALRAITHFPKIGVFENAAARGSGQFEPVELHVWVDNTHLDGARCALIEEIRKEKP